MQRSVKRVLKAPSRKQVLSTYRALIRATHQIQIRPELEHQALPPSPQWADHVRKEFKANASLTDQVAISAQYNLATEYTQLLQSTMGHDQHLRAGGWTLNVASKDLVGSVSKYVGLGLPKVSSPHTSLTGDLTIEDREKRNSK